MALTPAKVQNHFDAGKVIQQKPAMPTGLAASAQSPTRVRLTWTDNSPDEDGFVIERAIGPGSFAEIFRTGANQTVYRAVLRKGTYSYRIKTLKAGQLSASSNVVQLAR